MPKSLSIANDLRTVGIVTGTYCRSAGAQLLASLLVSKECCSLGKNKIFFGEMTRNNRNDTRNWVFFFFLSCFFCFLGSTFECLSFFYYGNELPAKPKLGQTLFAWGGDMFWGITYDLMECLLHHQQQKVGNRKWKTKEINYIIS